MLDAAGGGRRGVVARHGGHYQQPEHLGRRNARSRQAACSAALAPRSLAAISGGAIRRSRMPVHMEDPVGVDSEGGQFGVRDDAPSGSRRRCRAPRSRVGSGRLPSFGGFQTPVAGAYGWRRGGWRLERPPVGQAADLSGQRAFRRRNWPSFRNFRAAERRSAHGIT